MTVTNASAGPAFAHKIRPRHLDRLAIVYVRQSTPHQVANHRESTDLQYQLRRRAVGLGWGDDRVVVIDDDQGISGQSVENRPGFQRPLAEVSLGHVGIVFGREMSRLARSCKDWHQLLELCGLFQVLIGDADGVYDPTDANDRMLLGLRGMMSEAELHVLRSRLHQGKLNKARRGELFTCVPIGYVRTPDGGIALDPDEQVRSVVALVFTKFAELGSLTKTHAFFVTHGIRPGLRLYKGADKGQLVWQRPRRSTLYEMLRHPFYAGTYAYGRCPLDPTRRAAGKKPGRRNARPRSGCACSGTRCPRTSPGSSTRRTAAIWRPTTGAVVARPRRAARRRCSMASCGAAAAGGRCWRTTPAPRPTRGTSAARSSRSTAARGARA
jgi:DNA invertase Pin-like site-specific DNA recombinase